MPRSGLVQQVVAKQESKMSLTEERAQWEKQAVAQPMPAGVFSKEEAISSVPCIWLHTDSRKCEKKTVLYLHGGGLTSGSVLTHRNFAASIALATNASLLLVDYRLLPENPFPAPLEDAASVYRTLVAEERVRPEDLVFGGDSSGGGLALSALIQLRDEGVPLPSKFFTLSGVFDMTMSGESMRTDPKKEPFLRLDDLKDWQRTFFEDLDSPALSPLFAELPKLPRSLILAGADELWLSDSIRIHEKLLDEGNESEIMIWDSMTHVWAMDPNLKESTEALIAIRNFINDSANTSPQTT